MDWIVLALGVWAITGLIPALMLMFARARQSYYVDPLSPVRGAIQGPFALWTALAILRKERR